MKYVSQKYNGFEFEFEKVTVLLGANGAGKSKLLIELKSYLHSNKKKPVFVEGGRTIRIKDVIKPERNTYEQYELLDNAILQYENKRAESLANRLFDALVILDKKEQQIKSKHSDEVEKWYQEGQVTAFPRRPKPPLDRLFEMFSEIFPLIELEFNSRTKKLVASKLGEKYGPSTFSDGEKQVFSILADFIDLDESHTIIIADEPELNLHPELAERVWTLIENEFPGKMFIYATHSINFALRKNVEKVYVLSSISNNISNFENLSDLPRSETLAFLGGLPGILSANRIIVTEGHEKSFDAIFYRWILSDDKVEIYPAGSCSDVINVVIRNGLWSKIASKISLCGVIDSDYKSNENPDRNGSIFMLPFHEAESMVCLPKIIHAVARRIGSQERIIEESDVEKIAIDLLSEQKYQIVARRIFSKAKITLGVSIEKKNLHNILDKSDLIIKIKEAAELEKQKVDHAIGDEKLELDINKEYEEIETIITSKDIKACLKILPGKELLNQLAIHVGCKNSTDFMRALRTNFKPNDFPEILLLKNEIESRITT